MPQVYSEKSKANEKQNLPAGTENLAVDQEQEIWKLVKGYEGLYFVSNLGRVKSYARKEYPEDGIILKNVNTKSGYLKVRLCKNGIPKAKRIGCLVAETFLGEKINNLQVNHKDGNKKNDFLSNLEYVTPKQNIAHAWRNGLMVPMSGSKHGQSKLDELKVIKIRELHSMGTFKQYELAKKFNVCESVISSVISKKRWKHV